MRTDPFLFVSLNVADLDKAVEFYRDVLGMRQIDATSVPGNSASTGETAAMLEFGCVAPAPCARRRQRR